MSLQQDKYFKEYTIRLLNTPTTSVNIKQKQKAVYNALKEEYLTLNNQYTRDKRKKIDADLVVVTEDVKQESVSNTDLCKWYQEAFPTSDIAIKNNDFTYITKEESVLGAAKLINLILLAGIRFTDSAFSEHEPATDGTEDVSEEFDIFLQKILEDYSVQIKDIFDSLLLVAEELNTKQRSEVQREVGNLKTQIAELENDVKVDPTFSFMTGSINFAAFLATGLTIEAKKASNIEKQASSLSVNEKLSLIDAVLKNITDQYVADQYDWKFLKELSGSLKQTDTLFDRLTADLYSRFSDDLYEKYADDLYEAHMPDLYNDYNQSLYNWYKERLYKEYSDQLYETYKEQLFEQNKERLLQEYLNNKESEETE